MRIELDPSDTEGLQRLKDKAMMLRIIVLDEQRKSPLTNVSRLNTREKLHLKTEIEKKWSMPDDEIRNLFNEICTQTIFDRNEFETMPVISSGKPELPEEELEHIKKLPVAEQLKRTGQVYNANPDK
jgi:hypothetical protein